MISLGVMIVLLPTWLIGMIGLTLVVGHHLFDRPVVPGIEPPTVSALKPSYMGRAESSCGLVRSPYYRDWKFICPIRFVLHRLADRALARRDGIGILFWGVLHAAN